MDKDVAHIYNGILLSHQKELNKAICSNMDELSVILSDASQTEMEKYHMTSLICGI